MSLRASRAELRLIEGRLGMPDHKTYCEYLLVNISDDFDQNHASTLS
jgi:hypothetical protein